MLDHDQPTIEVVGTVRYPDCHLNGRIAELVIGSAPPNLAAQFMSEQVAIICARAGLLFARVPGDGHPVKLIAVDKDKDGSADFVRTVGDSTTANNLRELPIWCRQRKQWMDAATGKEPASPPLDPHLPVPSVGLPIEIVGTIRRPDGDTKGAISMIVARAPASSAYEVYAIGAALLHAAGGRLWMRAPHESRRLRLVPADSPYCLKTEDGSATLLSLPINLFGTTRWIDSKSGTSVLAP